MTTRWFNGRRFIALLTAFCFLVLLLTGLVLYVEPYGRVAYWIDWRFLGLDKDQWDGIHIVASFIFLISAALHVFYNWKPLTRYLSGRIRQGVRQWRELMLASGIIVLSVVGGGAHWYPFEWLLELNEAAKTAWEADPAQQPPFGHAEMVSLSSLCRQLGMDEDAAMARLRSAGLRMRSHDQTVTDLARSNGVSPRQVLEIMERGNAATPGRGKHLQSGWQAAGPAEPGMPNTGGEAGCSGDDPMGEHDGRRHAGQGRGRHRVEGGQGTQGGQGRHAGGRLAGDSLRLASVFRRHAGHGLGRCSLATLCAELELPVEQGMQALSKQGIVASPGQSIKSVATRHGMRPSEVLTALCRSGGCK